MQSSPVPCRFCGGALGQIMADLGATPLANGFLTEAQLAQPEPRYPLRVLVCPECHLAQVEETVPPEVIFDGDYAYFSSYSSTWLEHACRFAVMARERFGLGPDSLVVEVASNDGYLLRHFAGLGVPVLGIEPAGNVAEAARGLGIPTEICFFGRETAERLRDEGRRADLLIGNNVLAHVPDVNGFVAGLARLLAPGGVLSLEFPHLLRLLQGLQFDTIYHEHYFYFSLLSAERVLEAYGLAIFDLEVLPTHGGSLRLYARHAALDPAVTPAVEKVRAEEAAAGLRGPAPYAAFADAIPAAVKGIRDFLEGARAEGRQVAAYGAAAKGNTLLNACGIGRDLVAYAVDASRHKQGRFTPGSHLPVHAPARLAETRPDIVLILPWNLAEEIVAANPEVRSWGGRFLVPLPAPRFLD